MSAANWGRGGLNNFFRGQMSTKNPLLRGRDNLAESNCESNIDARLWGDNFCREALRCLVGPSGNCSYYRCFGWGEASSLTVGASLLIVELVCLQSIGTLLKRTFQL